jgi:hypothetical protein
LGAGGIGGLLIGLTVIFLLLFAIKIFYVSLPADLFFAEQGEQLRQFIDSLLRPWPTLVFLWRAIPLWQPIHTLATAPLWAYVYVIWVAMVVGLIGGFLLRSARARRAQITEFR